MRDLATDVAICVALRSPRANNAPALFDEVRKIAADRIELLLECVRAADDARDFLRMGADPQSSQVKALRAWDVARAKLDVFYDDPR